MLTIWAAWKLVNEIMAEATNFLSVNKTAPSVAVVFEDI